MNHNTRQLIAQLVYSLYRALRPPAFRIEPFQEDGSPSEALQRSCADAGLLAVEFPYTSGGYVIHLGRGSLREVAAAQDRTNRYYRWATTHNEPHFALEADAPAAYAAFRAAFARAVPTLDPANLVQACR